MPYVRTVCVLVGGDLHGANNARQADRVGQLQVCEIARPEPAKVVVLVGYGVDRFPFPTRDKERVHVEGGSLTVIGMGRGSWM
jgi:hypothetical protein